MAFSGAQKLLNGFNLYLGQLDYQPTVRDPKNDGFAYAKVPDWVLRQWQEVAAGLVAESTPTPTPSGSAQHVGAGDGVGK